MSALPFAAVAVGAVLGAWLRWGLGVWLNPLWPEVPLGTLAANLVGGLLVGAAIEFFGQYPGLAPEWRLALITGFLGALTTFSTFSAESATLLLRGQYAWAVGHAALHLVGSLALTLAGMALLRAVVR
ncbi:MAG: fluoride efflux transporter CrcB [Burkholderiaceae bacterium]|nr:fluoride efflux transporter CrcB [Burkholderiaceae bacterium]